MNAHLPSIRRRELIQISASTVAVGALNALITSDQRRAMTTYAFHDEFDGPAGSAPNPALWGYDTGRWTDNNELETYTSSRANSYLDGKGHLVIRALPSRHRDHGYTSARLQTQGKFSQNHGTWEARVKCDRTRGTWPAWWLLGDNIGEVGWPQCGEVDMLEVYGQPGAGADSTVHVADANGTDTTSEAIIPGGVDTGWHVWRLRWDPATGNLQFYKDPGPTPTPYLTVKPGDLPSWPFGTPGHPGGAMFMILNLAVGGDGGGTVPSHFQPAAMLVDYVRVW